MLLLVVLYLAFVVVQALMRARGKDGALCATGAASSDLTGEEILHAQFLIALLQPLGRSVGRSLGRWFCTDRMRQSGQAFERDDWGARDEASS